MALAEVRASDPPEDLVDADPATADRLMAARALLPRVQQGDDIRAEAEELVEQAREAGDAAAECAALYSALAASAVRADSDRSHEAATAMVQRAASSGLTVWESTGRQYLARLHLSDGHEDIALREIVAAELLVDDAPADLGLVVALNGIGMTYARLGLHEDCERIYTRMQPVVSAAKDRWAEHAFVYNRLLNQAAWGVSLVRSGLPALAQERLTIAAEQAREAVDMSGSSARHDFAALCLFTDLMIGSVDVLTARARLGKVLAHSTGEPQSYVRFALAHRLADEGQLDAARIEIGAGLAAVNPLEREPIRSTLVWQRAKIAVIEDPGHEGLADAWTYAELMTQQVWELRRRRMESAHDRLRVGRMRREHQRVEQASLEDPLTGAANRRRIDRERAALLTLTVSDWTTVLYIDIDEFKPVNDTHGHELGDDVLRQLATLLAASVRDGDLVGRYGGDEFVVLARHCPPDDAQQLGDRVLDAVRQHAWDSLHPSLEIRVSIGMAATRANQAHLFPAADEALYRAKRAGRDRSSLTVIGAEGELTGVVAPVAS